jgi:hopanoid biosynthesis associated RND transporter like protein HpnN
MMAQLTERWWWFVSKWNAQIVWVTVAMALLSLATFLKWGSLNSDLGQLIRPDTHLDWYQANERFKRDFPQFQQTALVVITGDDARIVAQTARDLSGVLRTSGTFSSVFAPGVDPFIETHKLYFLSLDQLKEWKKGADYNYPSMLRLADEASLNNLALTIADFVTANPGLPLPISLSSGLDMFEHESPGDFSAFYPLVDPDQTSFTELIVVQGIQKLDQPLPNAEIVASLESLIAPFVKAGKVEIALTGEVVLAHEEIGAALSGIEIAGLLSLILLLLILGLGLRSWPLITIIFVKLLLGTSLTLGLATMIVGSFNTLSMLFVVMFFGLGIDFSVHYVLRAMAEGRIDRASLSHAFRDTSPALALCTVTSAIAFLSFVPTSYRGLAELGLISACGMVIALLLTLFFIPSACLYWTQRQSPRHSARSLQGAKTGFWPTQVIAQGILIGAPLLLALSMAMTFNYSVLSMRDADSPAMRALVKLQEAGLGTDYSIQLLAGNTEEADRLRHLLEQKATVASVTTPGDWVPSEGEAKAGVLADLETKYLDIEILAPTQSDPSETQAANQMVKDYVSESLMGLDQDEAAPLDRLLSVIAQYEQLPSQRAALEQTFRATLEGELAKLLAMLGAKPPSLETLPSTFRSRLISPHDEHLLTISPTIALTDRTRSDRFVADVRSVRAEAAGRTMVEWGIGQVVVDAFAQAIVTTLLIVLVLLFLYFRRLTPVLLVMVPIGLTMIYTLGIAQAMGLSLNMANILMIPLVIGLGVDTGIHLVHRYENPSTSRATEATHRAVIISGLTTCGTFFSLSFSPHGGAASIGLLLTLAISMLLIISLSVLPFLLKSLGHPRLRA